MRMTQDAHRLLEVAQTIARLRGAGECTTFDVAAAAAVLSHQANKPIGFPAARTSPNMLPMSAQVQRAFEAGIELTVERLIAAASGDESVRKFLAGE